MHWHTVLWVALLSGAAMHAGAAECYLLGAYGSGTYDKTHGKFEDKILSFHRSGEFRGHTYDVRTIGGYDIDTGSTPYEWGGGCDFGRYFAVEASYRRGFEMQINGAFGLRAVIDDERYETPLLQVRERIRMEGIGVSMLGKYPLSESFSLTGRLGVMRGKATLTVALPQLTFMENEFLVKEERGNLPIVGVGLLYRPAKRWSFAWEYVKYNQESVIQNFMVRCYF